MPVKPTPVRLFAVLICAAAFSVAASAQAPSEPASPAPVSPNPSSYTVETGTHVPLGLINSVSTKHSVAGDRIYLETVFPIVIDSHIVIPPGSYVTGTVTEVKRPGRVKGRAELYVRFDSLTLPNGVTRQFRSRLGAIDARGTESLEKKEGMVQGDSNRGGDLRTVGEVAATGASIGAVAGSAASHAAMGAGLGAAAGAATGIAGVLLTRGPEAVLAKGSTIEMVLDRPLTFAASEVNFAPTTGSGHFSEGPAPESGKANPGASRRIPY